VEVKSVDRKELGSALNASLLLDGDDRILEANRDAEVFLEKPLEEVRKALLYKANASLYSALKELIGKSKRGRGVEDYALAYKVGKRLMRLNISISPYPLEALGTTGTLITITTLGGRPLPERREPRQEKPSQPEVTAEISDLTQTLNSMAEPAFILDIEAVFTFLNPAMVSLMGHAEDEIIGRPLSFFMLREEAKKSLEYLVEAARSAPWRGELEFSRADGTSCNIAVTVDLLRSRHKGRRKPEGLLGLGRDNTTEARIRRERKDELERVWRLLESVGSAVICFTPDFRVTLLSLSAGDMLKTTPDRAIGTPLPELFPGDTAQEITTLLELALKGEEVKGAEVRMARAKGEKRGEKRTFVVEIKPAVLVEGGAREYIMFLKEATMERSEMDRAQLQLKESAARNEFLELALASRDVDGYLSGCLAVLEGELGCSASAGYILDDKEAMLRAGRGINEESMDTLSVFKFRPGKVGSCEQLDKLVVEIHGGVPKKGWNEVNSLIEKADSLLPLFRENRWREVHILPLREEETLGALALVDCDPEKIDGTGQKTLGVICETIASVLSAFEVGEAEDKAGDSQVSLDDLNRSLHEAVISSGPEEDRKENLADDRTRTADLGQAIHVHEEHDLLEVALEAKRVKPEQNHLSLWGDDADVKVSPSARGIDLHSLILEIREYYSRRGHSGEIFVEIEDDLPKLHSDKRLLRESIMHLLDNAIRYSPSGAPVILGVERWGDEVLLRVEDQGPGIPAQVVEDVMREKESTAIEERPSGLLLTRKYVTAMGGDLTIKGVPQEGTTAFIRIRVLPFVGELL
jgi:PAS domain S-box-containing protein